jgi:hypothetical protein
MFIKIIVITFHAKKYLCFCEYMYKNNIWNKIMILGISKSF